MTDPNLSYRTPAAPQGLFGRSVRGRFRWVILALLFVGITINYIDRLVISLVFTNDFKAHYGIDPLHFGIIVSSFAFIYAIGQIFSGWMLDKIGTRVGYSLSLLAWSACAMLTALGGGWLSFAIFRGMLGFAESPSYPGAAKICAEWFPQRERSYAFGWVNAGANMAAIITPLLVPWLVIRFGWQSAFIWTGGMGMILLLFWFPIVRPPEHHSMVSEEELQHIHSDPPEPVTKVPWGRLLSYRQTWVIMAGKIFTDGVWWFFISWLPSFFYDNYHLDIKNIGLPLIVIYLLADIGSVGGGMLSSFLIRRGASVNFGRKITMLISGCLAIPIALAPFSHSWGLWPTVCIVGIAVAGHQGFSSNLYTLCSDMFPKRAVASVAGLAGFCGYMGSTAFNYFVGWWNQYTGNYIAPFACAAVAYVASITIMHLISPNFQPAIIDTPGFPIESNPDSARPLADLTAK